MKIEHASFASMPSRQRATLINSLAGIKQAVLVGTVIIIRIEKLIKMHVKRN